MKRLIKSIPWMLTGILLPVLAKAQDGGADMAGFLLHTNKKYK